MRGERPARGMGGHERLLGELRDVPQAVIREVADVQDHARALHVGDGGHPQARETAAGVVLARAVRELRAAVPRE